MVRNPLDIERLLRIIDDDNLDANGKASYDELDDEEDIVLVIKKGEDPNLPQGLMSLIIDHPQSLIAIGG